MFVLEKEWSTELNSRRQDYLRSSLRNQIAVPILSLVSVYMCSLADNGVPNGI